MQWTYRNYKHYSAEHMQKAEKQRLGQQMIQASSGSNFRWFRGREIPRTDQ